MWYQLHKSYGFEGRVTIMRDEAGGGRGNSNLRSRHLPRKILS